MQHLKQNKIYRNSHLDNFGHCPVRIYFISVVQISFTNSRKTEGIRRVHILLRSNNASIESLIQQDRLH